MKLILLISFSFLFLFSCATNKYQVNKVDNEIDAKGKINNQVIGIDKNDQAVIHEEIRAVDELQEQIWANQGMLDDLKYEAFQLKRCKRDLSDPRLEGDGKMYSIPNIDNLKDPVYVKEEFGIVEDDLKFVKKSMFIDQLRAERNYGESLKRMFKIVKDHREHCEMKMRRARLKVGLPAKRFQGKGHFENNQWVQDAPHEHDLDDAFRIIQIKHK